MTDSLFKDTIKNGKLDAQEYTDGLDKIWNLPAEKMPSDVKELKEKIAIMKTVMNKAVAANEEKEDKEDKEDAKEELQDLAKEWNKQLLSTLDKNIFPKGVEFTPNDVRTILTHFGVKNIPAIEK